MSAEYDQPMVLVLSPEQAHELGQALSDAAWTARQES
jgi:hypothetical protein